VIAIVPELPSLEVPVAKDAPPLTPAAPAFDVLREIEPLEASELAPLVR
jgi:hypothetical protein